MTSDERVTFDTNILFYALDSDGGDRHLIAAKLLRWARPARSVLLLQSLAELYNAVRKRPDIAADRAQEFIENNMEVFPVLALDTGIYYPLFLCNDTISCTSGTRS